MNYKFKNMLRVTGYRLRDPKGFTPHHFSKSLNIFSLFFDKPRHVHRDSELVKRSEGFTPHYFSRSLNIFSLFFVKQRTQREGLELEKNGEGFTHSPKVGEGFTLMEIVVSLAIFATTVTMILVIFNFVLRIQRQTEASRQVAQAVRNFAESLTKEIRNGQVDYGYINGVDRPDPLDFSGQDSCEFPEDGEFQETFSEEGQDHISIINVLGERECIFFDGNVGSLYIQKSSLDELQRLSPENVTVLNAWFTVRPTRDPYMTDAGAGGLVGHQPVVTLLLDMSVNLPGVEERRVLYQTSVSTYQYDIPHD